MRKHRETDQSRSRDRKKINEARERFAKATSEDDAAALQYVEDNPELFPLLFRGAQRRK